MSPVDLDMASIHISLAAEEIARISGIPVTNSLLTTWLVMAFIIVLSVSVYSRLSMVPGYLQIFAELLVGGINKLFEEILHEKNKIYFPYLATLFIFIIFQNWSGLLPGVGTIGFTYEEESMTTTTFIPLLRSGTADLNTTLALALLTIGYIQFAGLKALGATYLKKFFNFSNPIYTFVGVLELISEISRIISFAFRLFGNIFAGEVLLTVIAFLIPVIAPIPFLGLELFVGFIQALVFSMLSAVFFSLATERAEH